MTITSYEKISVVSEDDTRVEPEVVNEDDNCKIPGLLFATTKVALKKKR